jgi:predicted small integral membrane protein
MGFTFSWMAWTWPTALFFIFIATLLIGMVIWERFVPGGSPRRGATLGGGLFDLFI